MGQQLTPALAAADLATTVGFAAFAAYLVLLVRRFGAAAGALAVQQYNAERKAAGVGGRFTPTPAQVPTTDQVSATLGWATAPLRADNPKPGVEQIVAQRVTSGAERMVLDVGRQTIVTNTLRDTKASGWERVTEPGTCAFCALLASRGAVYRSEQAGDFTSHDHCRCHAAPIFGAYHPSAQVRSWQALYASASAGRRGAEVVPAFRKAFDKAAS